jgi:glycosyltransferase involved in cell wall biosynthesis
MRIAIFDYLVTSSNPVGSCHRLLVDRLSDKFHFTVFAKHFENPRPDSVRWVRVPSLLRPLVALFASYHIAAVIQFLRHRRDGSFSLIQSVESNLSFGDVVYAHFCHRWFLRHKWRVCRPPGFRGMVRWLDHAFHAALEPWVFRHASWVVAASWSLARELGQEYPFVVPKLRVIPNPVDLDAHAPNEHFNRESFRDSLGVASSDVLVVFAALGQFERKGLPTLLSALGETRLSHLKVCVVGGTPDLVADYQSRVAELGLNQSVCFAGFHPDIRSYLWAADLIALPSLYEVFPLVVLQAAAASRPLLVTWAGGGEPLSGAGCLVVEPSTCDVARGLSEFCQMSPDEQVSLGRQARDAALQYGIDPFISAWEELYEDVTLVASNG